jgi:hypothetical protein
MTALPVPPHRHVRAHPGFYVLVATVSLLLSLWAIYLDPVINSDGIGDVRAAQHLYAAEWRAGLAAAGSPVYAVLGAVVSRITGLSAVYSLYALAAVFFALLAAGYVALASVLGGSRRTRLLAALVVLLFPALNGFRPDITGDAGYWAFYVWSLAYFMHYAAVADRGSLARWGLAGLAAMLFAVEALVFLLLLPLWLFARNAPGVWRRPARVVVAAAAVTLLLLYALWQQAWQSQVPVVDMLLKPGHHFADAWHATGQALRFKLDALRIDFMDQYSVGFADAAMLSSLLVIVAAGLINALGGVYAVLTGYAVAVSGKVLNPGQRYWWGVFAVLGSVLLLAPALTRFEVDTGDAMIAALTILAVVPLALERLWRVGDGASGRRRWLLPLAVVLVTGSGLTGLDLRSQQLHLREAGLWLRDMAPPGASMYSNSPVIAYYSGLDDRAARNRSWPRAMTMARRERWRAFDWLALVIDAENPHREGILLRAIDADPVRVLTSEAGDKVLIFDSRR